MKYIKKYRFIIYLLIIIIIGSIGYINFNNKQKYTELVIERKTSDEEVVPTETRKPIDFAAMKKKYNKDIIAALRIVDEDFEEIIFQSKDNKYYLKHDYKGNSSVNGEIFADYRINIDESKIKLIFGHTAPSYKLPSNTFEKYYDKSYYDKHKYIELETEKGIYKYEIFSVYVETSDWYYMNIKFNDQINYYNHYNKLKKNSMYDTGVNISGTDEILVFQTCSNKKEYQKYSKKYLVISAKKVKM
jgi:sortase B